MRFKGLVKKFVSVFVVLSMLATSVPVYAGGEGETDALSLLSKEHQATFTSLLNQINSQGIGVWAAGGEEALSPSGIDYRTRVALEITEPVMVSYESDQTAVFKFSLLYPHSREVSFDYVIYPGSMGAEYYHVSPAKGTVTFGTGETEKELEITIPRLENNPVEYGIASDLGAFWTGDKIFYIFCSNIRNALFVNNKDTMTLPVPIENRFDLQAAYSKARSTPLIDLNNPAQISGGISSPETPGKYRPEKGEDGSAQIRLKGAALEGDLRIMIDLGVFSHLSLPVGYMSYSPGEEEPAMGDVWFSVEKYLIFPSDPSEAIGPVSAGYMKSIPVEGNQETRFNLEESGQVEIGQVGLGTYFEGNGLTKSLDFVFDYAMLPGEVSSYFHDQGGNFTPEQIYFSDQVSPRVAEVHLAADPAFGNSTFYPGDIIPITVRYSEPVQSDGIVITANGQQLSPVEREGTISATMSFLYEIDGDEESEKAIRVTALSGAVDLAGNPQEPADETAEYYLSYSWGAFQAEKALAYYGRSSVNLNPGEKQGEILLTLGSNTELRDWLGENTQENKLVDVVKARVIGKDGLAVDVPLYADSPIFMTQLRGTFELPVNETGEAVNYVAEICLDPDLSDDKGFEQVFGLSTLYTVGPLIFIDDESDLEILYQNWPATNKLAADSTDPISLGYEVKVNASWQRAEDFSWSSNNETVATINSAGEITLTGEPGSVSFTLTAHNGGQADEFSLTSKTLELVIAEAGFLNVPESGRNLEVQIGSNARISYSTNLVFRNDLFGGSGTATPFSYTLYEAVYTGSELQKGKQLQQETLQATVEAPLLFYTLAAEQLVKTTPKGKYGYILEISAVDLQSEQRFTAAVNIRVKGLPARAVLHRPESYYQTDAEAGLTVGCQVENFDADTELLLTVVKNQDSEPVFTSQAASDMGKELRIPIAPVSSNRLLDVYTISLKAKNDSNEAFSSDSYTIYVYNADALKIMVDGVAKDQLTMSLEDELSQKSSQELLALQRKIRLTNQLTINNQEYKWSRVADQIVWELGDEGKIALKYNDNGTYRDIQDYSLPGFPPGAAFLLEGISAGSTSVTATHALTGMKAQLAVQVDKLEDKLFFFQTYPAVECEISYINGDGFERRATTDSAGRYAVYEKSGIVSDVTFRPTSTLGTYDYAILKNELLKGNQNAAKDYGLYPQNIVSLPQMNYQLDLQLYDSASKMAYTEDLLIRGGVYRNGKYCPSATINGKKGNEDQIVKNNQGLYTLSFNPQEFTTVGNWNPLGPKDKVEYVIELRFAEGSYYNKFITIDSDTIERYRAFRLPIMENEAITPVNSGSIKDKLTIISQTVIIDDEEKPVPRELYYDKMPEKALLKTDLMLSGDTYDSYWFLLLDEYGRPWLNGLATSKTYEFSDTVVLSRTLDIRPLMEELKPGEKVSWGLKVSGSNVPGSYTMQGIIPGCLTIYNVINIPSISQSMQNGDLADVASDISNLTWQPTLGSIGIGDNEVKGALNFIADYSISTDSIRLEIEPTEDPFLYKGVIKFAAGDLTRENPSGVFSAKVEGRENLSFVPGLSDLKAIKKGDYLKKSKEKMESSMKGTKGSYKTYGGGAYLECEIYYDVWDQEWQIRLLVTDIYLGAGGGYVRKENLWVGPVPVTAEFRAGFTAQVGMKNFVEDHEVFGKLNSTIYELRPYFYIYGFGGIGQDYEVVSFEVGPYGKISLDQMYLFYNNGYQNLNGQKVTIAGSTGVKFEVSLLFAKYSKTFEIARASKSWELRSFDKIYELYESVGKKSKSRMMLGSSPAEEAEISLVPLESKAAMEDRTYLDSFTRSWAGSGREKSLALPAYSAAGLSASSITVLESNTYPNANPLPADDGSLLVYLSDNESTEIKDTAILASVRNEDGSYPKGTEIAAADYPDSDAVIAGTAGGAIVAWNRVFSDFSKGAGAEATYEDFINIYSGAEIMAGVYKDGRFTVEQLTRNSSPDLAPVVATNGDKAIVVWHSVSLGDGENFLDFKQDNLMYAIYDGTSWSEAQCLYEGHKDKVKALNAAMLADGTAAVAYEIAVQDIALDGEDSEEAFAVNNREIVCAVLDNKGEITNIRLTNNTSGDRNPRITAVEFPDGAERFVLGWNASRKLASGEEQDTVRLSALDGNGRLYPEFEMEIADNPGSGNYQNFKFAQGAKKLEELSVLWTEAEVNGLTASDFGISYQDHIWGQQFLLEDDGTYALSGKQKIVEIPDNYKLNFFAGYLDSKNRELNFSLLLSETGAAGTRVDMATAKSSYRNSLLVEEAYFSYEELLPGLDMPILFRLYNAGIQPISKLTINLAGENHTIEEKIKPGESKDITVLYQVPATVVNPSYSIKAEFGTSPDLTEQTVNGTLKLALPDVGISQIRVTKETERERSFQVWLGNNTYGKLEEGKHTVQVEVYDSPDFSGKTPLAVKTFSDAASLNKMNEGTLTVDLTLKEEDLRGLLDERGEIPEEGAWVFFRTVLLEKETPTAEEIPIEDADISNDLDYVKIYSLLTKKGVPVSLASMMERKDNQTLVQVEAFNNSMNRIANGNIIVNLIDENGRVIDTRQSYRPETGGTALLSVEGEEGTQQTFTFSTPAASMEAVFAQVVPASAKLSVLKFSGVPLDFDRNVQQYDLQLTDLSSTGIILAAEDPAATIRVTQNGTPVSLTAPCSLAVGNNEFIIKVQTGAVEETYTVKIFRESSGSGGDDNGGGNNGGGNNGGGNNGGDNNSESNDKEDPKQPSLPPLVDVVRISGSNRVDTALAIAKTVFPGKVANVVLTTAYNYPDALAGSVLAYGLNGPILLLGSSPEEQAQVMEYLASSLEAGGSVYILGGAGTVGQEIEDQLLAAGIQQPVRIAGEDRYETAVNIVRQLDVPQGTPLVLVSGENFPDALAVSSIAAQSRYPVLLVSKDGMSDGVKELLADISPEQIYIIGLQGVISSGVEDQAARIAGLEPENMIRIGGANRYQTSLAVAQYFVNNSSTVCIATGRDFPDALAGSILAAFYQAPIILADDSLSDEALNYLQSQNPTGSAVFGGEAAVGTEVVQQLQELIETN